jgi:hypothetical protein
MSSFVRCSDGFTRRKSKGVPTPRRMKTEEGDEIHDLHSKALQVLDIGRHTIPNFGIWVLAGIKVKFKKILPLVFK